MSKKYVSVLKDSAATPGYRIIAPEDYVYTDNGTKKVKKIDSKADKKVPATAGNLATLDSTGNLADSGKQTTDFMNALTTAYEASGSATKTVTKVTQAKTGAVAVTYSDIQSGTTSQKGLVQLEDSTSSTSVTKAATPNSVKRAYDLANGKYSKPSGGIPSSDMDSTVQASLGKADTAIQGVKLNGSTLTPSSAKVVDLGDLKTKQTAVSDPSASGTTITAIATISQNANGVITATKKTIQSASQSQDGVMSAADKTKLDGIATGAEVNQNAFSNVKVGDVTVAADAKTDTLTLAAGSNVTITPDATNDKITIAAKDTTYTADAGIRLDGTVFKHTNSVSGGTVGPTTDTAGATLSVPYVTYDSQGHVTASGTRTHNVGTASTSGAGIVQLQDSIDATTTKAATPNAVKKAIEALDVSSVGGSGKYISAISETDGKISATATTMDSTPTASSEKAVTSGGVKTELDKKADDNSVIAIADATVTRSNSSEWFKVAEYTYSNTSGFVWNGTWMATLNGTTSDRVPFGGLTFIIRFAARFANTSSAPSVLSFSTSPVDESLKSLINSIKFKLVFDISGSATVAKLYYSPKMTYCMLALREVMGGIGNTANVKSLWAYTSYSSSTAGESTEPVGNSANITMTWTYATSTASIPTKLSDLTDDITTSTYSSTGTAPVNGTAVASAISSKASSTHTHGNITNGGALQTNDITIASGDKLVVTDSSDSNKVARTSISFDGSTATKALTQKGTWETFNNYSHPAGSAPSKTGVPTANATPGFGGTFKVNQITTDSTSHVSAVTERTITIPNATATTSAAGLMSASDYNRLNGSQNIGEHDADACTTTGFYYGSSNMPPTSLGWTERSSGNDGALFVQAYSSSWVGQIGQDYRTGNLFIRGKNNGTYMDWKRIPYLSVKNRGGTTTPVYVDTNGEIQSCTTYAGGTAVTLNNSSKAGSTASFYAPTAGGTANYVLIGNGATSAPTWAEKAPKAVVADYPAGFTDRLTSWSWGTLITGNGYTQLSSWKTSGGGQMAFAKNTESGSDDALSVQIDGTFYQHEGKHKVLDAADVSVPSTVPTLAWNTESTLATIDGKNIKVKLPASPDTDVKVTQTVDSATTGNLPLLAKNTTGTATITDTSRFAAAISMTPSTGTVNATQYKVNEHCTMKYNSTKSSLDFTFS